MEPRRYLVELRPSASGLAEIQALGARSRLAAKELSRRGQPVRFLRSVFVPEDELCFLLFEAASADDARAATIRAELGVARVGEVVRAHEAA